MSTEQGLGLGTSYDRGLTKSQEEEKVSVSTWFCGGETKGRLTSDPSSS